MKTVYVDADDDLAIMCYWSDQDQTGDQESYWSDIAFTAKGKHFQAIQDWAAAGVVGVISVALLGLFPVPLVFALGSDRPNLGNRFASSSRYFGWLMAKTKGL